MLKNQLLLDLVHVDADYFQLSTVGGDIIEMVDFIRYLGVYFVNGRLF